MKNFVFVLIGCLSANFGFAQKVGYSSKTVDYNSYKTYNFMEITFEDGVLTPDRQKAIGILKSGVSQQLEKRDIKFSLEPDIEVNVLIVITDHQITRETDFRDIQRGYGTGTSQNYSWKAQEIIVRQFQKGSATLNFVDNKKDELIWQGIITETREEGQGFDKLEKSLKKSIEKLMKKYPVK